ncbi:MAG: transcription-repair coupling factor, partial [Alphaproteobacteria bacterium]
MSESNSSIQGLLSAGGIEEILAARAPVVITGAPEGADAPALGELARALLRASSERPAALMHIARDDKRLAALESALAFFAPDAPVISIPAWDCVPYDRVSPNGEIASRRIAGLASLALRKRQKPEQPVILLTTVNAAIQRVPPRDFFRCNVQRISAGETVELDGLIARLESLGYMRTGNVMEPGEYAVRGGIVDLFPPGRKRPLRLDFFGDLLEAIRSFDPETQRTRKTLREFFLLPVCEVPFGEETVRRFRQRYVELFGPVTASDPLYEAVSAGARFPGMEHWLPLFHERLETLFDYVPGASVSFDHMAEDARAQRL